MEPIHPQRRMLQGFTNALRRQEILDSTIDNLTDLHLNGNPLAIFCEQVELSRVEIAHYLQPNTLNFVMENAISAGGSRVALACAALQERCITNDPEGAIAAYPKVKWECYILRDCFRHILQAERKIYCNN